MQQPHRYLHNDGFGDQRENAGGEEGDYFLNNRFPGPVRAAEDERFVDHVGKDDRDDPGEALGKQDACGQRLEQKVEGVAYDGCQHAADDVADHFVTAELTENGVCAGPLPELQAGDKPDKTGVKDFFFHDCFL